jgi:hypothetical protein
VSSAPGRPWLASFDRGLLFRILNQRTLEVALASPLQYPRAPTWSESEGVVRAYLEDPSPPPTGRPSPAPVFVSLGMGDGATRLSGDCSRCMVSFGP